jgi:hypothetical protein
MREKKQRECFTAVDPTHTVFFCLKPYNILRHHPTSITSTEHSMMGRFRHSSERSCPLGAAHHFHSPHDWLSPYSQPIGNHGGVHDASHHDPQACTLVSSADIRQGHACVIHVTPSNFLLPTHWSNLGALTDAGLATRHTRACCSQRSNPATRCNSISTCNLTPSSTP